MGIFDGKSQKEMSSDFKALLEEQMNQQIVQQAQAMSAMSSRPATATEIEARYRDRLAQMQAMQQQHAVQSANALGGLLNAGRYATQAYQDLRINPTLTVDALNNDPVYGPPLSVVRDLWLARWGDGWVDLAYTSLEDASYWVSAQQRLESSNMLERHPQGKFARLR